MGSDGGQLALHLGLEEAVCLTLQTVLRTAMGSALHRKEPSRKAGKALWPFGRGAKTIRRAPPCSLSQPYRVNTNFSGVNSKSLSCLSMKSLASASSVQPSRQRVSHRKDRFLDEVRPHRLPRNCSSIQRRHSQANKDLLEIITNFTNQKQATPTQIALAWLLARQPIVPLPGITKLS